MRNWIGGLQEDGVYSKCEIVIFLLLFSVFCFSSSDRPFSVRHFINFFLTYRVIFVEGHQWGSQIWERCKICASKGSQRCQIWSWIYFIYYILYVCVCICTPQIIMHEWAFLYCLNTFLICIEKVSLVYIVFQII